jgi:hypothetical protein
MGAVMPYGSHLMPLAPSGAGWEPWGWSGSREAMCTFGSIAAHLLPLWLLLWKRNAGVGLAAGSYHAEHSATTLILHCILSDSEST